MTQLRGVKAGEELPPFTRTTGFANWNRYAAVNDEFVPIHMDDEAGRAAGYPTAFGMGNLQWAYLHNLVRDWLGDDGAIVSLKCQFRAANTKGMTVTARGVVTAVREDGGKLLADLDIWTEDSEGNKLAPGSALVELDLRCARAGSPCPRRPGHTRPWPVSPARGRRAWCPGTRRCPGSRLPGRGR
jgi:acyl dehydratase